MEMRPACERCDQELPMDGRAFVCSYECTFCVHCAIGMQYTCPNCLGELVPRPRRQPADACHYQRHQRTENAGAPIEERPADKVSRT
jgi:hypothetical protein